MDFQTHLDSAFDRSEVQNLNPTDSDFSWLCHIPNHGDNRSSFYRPDAFGFLLTNQQCQRMEESTESTDINLGKSPT